MQKYLNPRLLRVQGMGLLDATTKKFSFTYRRLSSVSDSSFCLLALFLGHCSVLAQTELVNPRLNPVVLILLILLLLSLRWRSARWALFFLAGWANANWQFLNHRQGLLAPQYEREELVVSGRVQGLPDRDKERTRFDFEIEVASLPDEVTPLPALSNKRVRLSCYHCPMELLPDKRWQLTVRMKRPNGFASWGAFDYEKYLFRHQFVATGYVRTKWPAKELVEANNGVHRWRDEVRESLNRYLEQDHAGSGIFKALALGDRSGLSSEHRRALQATGVSHLIAISGLHVGLVFLLVIKLVALLLWPFASLYERIPRPWISLPLGFIAAFGYAALAGFAIPTQRAVIMLGIYVVCQLLARDQPLVRVLLIAAVVICVLDPFSILDAGFWLSCFAVLVIALVSISSEKLTLWRLQPWLWLGMLPVTALLFGQVSLISPLVNLVMVPLFCLLLIPAVLVSLLISIVNFPLGGDAVSFMSKSLDGVYLILEVLSSLPLAAVYPPTISLFYAAVLVVLAVLGIRYRIWLLVFGLVAAAQFTAPSQSGQVDYQVSLLDVGQGLAMVIRIEDLVWVYDTGPSYASGFSTAEAVLIPYLRSLGVAHIDHLIISHADNDHIGGLADVLAAFDVKQISTSRPDRIPDDYGVPVKHCRAGQHWKVENVELRFISPDRDTPTGSNNQSCVLRIDNGQTKTLITGDIEKQVERYLLAIQSEYLDADILLVPHQGSKTSSTQEFVNAVNPEVALVAAGYLNHYGHPHADVLARYKALGVPVVSTQNSGSIRLQVLKSKIKMERFRHSQARFWRR